MGVTIAGTILFIVLPITICLIIWFCFLRAAAQPHRGRTYVTLAAVPTTAPEVVSTTSQKSTAVPTAAYPVGGYNYPMQVCVCMCMCMCICMCTCVCVCCYILLGCSISNFSVIIVVAMVHKYSLHERMATELEATLAQLVGSMPGKMTNTTGRRAADIPS